MNGARPDNHQQAVVLAVHQIGNFLTRLHHQFLSLIADGQFVQVGNRRQQFGDRVNADIIGFVQAVHAAVPFSRYRSQ